MNTPFTFALAAAWLALLAAQPVGATPPGTPGRLTPKELTLQAALGRMVIPKIDLHDVTVPEALEILRQAARRADPSGEGANIVLKSIPEPAPVALPPPASAFPSSPPDRRAILKKLSCIIIRNVEFHDVSVAEALAYLHQQSAILDPDGHGVNFVQQAGQPAPLAGPGRAAGTGTSATKSGAAP